MAKTIKIKEETSFWKFNPKEWKKAKIEKSNDIPKDISQEKKTRTN